MLKAKVDQSPLLHGFFHPDFMPRPVDWSVVANLVVSFNSVGMVQPIVIIPIPFKNMFLSVDEQVQQAKYVVVRGHNRFLAARICRIALIPSLIEERSKIWYNKVMTREWLSQLFIPQTND